MKALNRQDAKTPRGIRFVQVIVTLGVFLMWVAYCAEVALAPVSARLPLCITACVLLGLSVFFLGLIWRGYR